MFIWLFLVYYVGVGSVVGSFSYFDLLFMFIVGYCVCLVCFVIACLVWYLDVDLFVWLLFVVLLF